MRGVWNAPAQAKGATYPQQWHVASENLTTGAFSGTDVSGAASYALVGVVAGNHLSMTISNGSYTSRGQATISGSHGSGTFTDSNGTTGTFALTRLSGPPTTTPPPPSDQAKVCVGSCAAGTDVTYDPTLDPGQTSDTTTCNCSSTRTTSSVSSTASPGFGCSFDAIMKTLSDKPLPEEVRKAIDQALEPSSADLIAYGGLLDKVIKVASDPLKPVLTPEQSQEVEKIYQQYFDDLENSTSPAVAPALELADTTLSPDFPSSDRATASVHRAQLDLRPMPSPRLVLQSIAAKHPSAAAIVAFKAAVKLATSPTASPVRGMARLTLILAVSLGQRALAYDLRGQHGPIILAHAKTRVLAHHKKKLTLVATPLGGRILRMLEVTGLSRKTSIQLKLSSTYKGKTTHATRSIRVR